MVWYQLLPLLPQKYSINWFLYLQNTQFAEVQEWQEWLTSIVERASIVAPESHILNPSPMTPVLALNPEVLWEFAVCTITDSKNAIERNLNREVMNNIKLMDENSEELELQAMTDN